MRSLQQAIADLFSKPYVAKAAEIGRTIHAENGVGVACDAIEKQLQVALMNCGQQDR